MPTVYSRRIAKRALMGLVVVVFLLSGYVSAYIGVNWAETHGYLDPLFSSDSPLFVPVVSYVCSDLPGAREFDAFVVWCSADGSIPYGQVREMMNTMHDMKSWEDSKGMVRATGGDE